MSIKILLVRHGQTEWNRIERFRGHYDIELNTTGLEQAEKTAQRIIEFWKPTAIFSSPLIRAMQTAEKISQICHQPVQQELGLIDIDYGLWQGLTPSEVKENWPDELKNWYDQPEKAIIPAGESLINVQKRAMAFLASITLKKRNQVIVLVSHTVVNRLIILGVLGLGPDKFWQIHQDPCAINFIEKQDEIFKIFSMNDTCHLNTIRAVD